MPSSDASSIDRRRLRMVLRRERDRAGLTQEQVAGELEWSLSKIIRIEAGAVGVSINDARSLLRLYQVSEPGRVEQVLELARTARQRSWWSSYRSHVPASFIDYVGLESAATGLAYFNPGAFPGIVQTAEYARHIIRSTALHEITSAEVEVQVELRLRRQTTLLDRPSPPQIVIVVDESTLRRITGGAAVMVAQLRHLEQVSQRPGIDLRVLPFVAGLSAGLGPFVILDFDDLDRPVLYIDNLLQTQVVRDQVEVIDQYRRMFDRLRGAALDADASVALIRSVAGELD